MVNIKIRGNYLWWSAVHLADGILLALFGYLTSWDYVFVLVITILPLAVFHTWFNKGSSPDEREIGLLLKVHAAAGSVTVVLISSFHELLSNHIVVALWSIFILSRGAFGLYYFLKD
ncbi:MAG: hypothetical protein J7K88_07180 [Candidatus Fermentibacteraceae bacterium]|nr:hypothetical protein [Candidatus Fermentibacteraceae bacterium]